nr:hypothetical protein Iba_chr02eCG7810 [Ipomoea batatas]
MIITHQAKQFPSLSPFTLTRKRQQQPPYGVTTSPPTRYEQRAALNDGASSVAIGSDDGKLFSPLLSLFFDGDDGSWPATSMAAARRWLLSPTAEQHEAEQPAVVFDGHLFSVTLFRSASRGSM